MRIGQLFNHHSRALITPHRTGFYHIFWFQKGSPRHLVDFQPVDIRPDTILFLNKDTVQCFDTAGDYDGKIIFFTDSFFCRSEADTKFLKSSILFNDLLSVAQLQLGESSSAIADVFQQIERELANPPDHFQSDILHNLLHNLLLQAERERRKQGFFEIKKSADLDAVVLFKNLLESHFRTLKKVSDYACSMGVTDKRLSRATSNLLGKTPKQMIDERIVLEARRQLVYTRESVKEIGFDLGFDEPTNFIKYFRRHCHSTPSEFRAQFAPA